MKTHHSASSASNAKPSMKAAPGACKAHAAATAAPAAAPADAPPDLGQREDMIREAAYRYYLARGSVEGQELDDWLRAEAEIERAFSGGDSIEPATH